MHENSGQEERLWLQFKNGDKDAFAALYRQYSLPLIAYGFRLCPDKDVLKDQIQELFVELWNSRINLSLTHGVKFYLFAALRYKLIRFEKTRHTRVRYLSVTTDWASPLEESIEVTIIEKEVVESRKALLKNALKELTPRQQEVIHLRYYQGFSHDEIAHLLEMNHQSVSNLLHRALVRLRDLISLPTLTSFLLCFFLS